ncbi:MAG: peroxiredoxin [Candidatus Sumerlaeia bacterium]|nr:peroxiredoxin [Candidatus Sumerlaeia bacterium]
MKHTACALAALIALSACASNSTQSTDTTVAAGTTAQEEGDMLAIGTAAPAFTTKDNTGNTVSIADYKGAKNVVLVFYPGNNTPVCTAQLCEIRDEFANFEAKDTVVFGVNDASVESHAKFAGKNEFPFPLLVDADGKITSAYGSRGLLGITKRTVYGIDKNGVIVFAERGRPSPDKVLAAF